ncbi:N-acetylmuramoyl-L-alanine amidase family protein [Spartinivicinus poritis]|uniref:N-acetylmuramoyl-L-alanine amidase n=1 Tax=Spartinivicinus poritis TaxID=2994640 RepID=A0ABT5UH14_9GAMM|nr:N-acetylmuramoyl-L-alanine amidase [Spartinivicinus sp. A2-2]MDE1465686.1 N-acetylmuramoyl-L-alanine amidase [Spartinivicinus sp. A2-2]
MIKLSKLLFNSFKLLSLLLLSFQVFSNEAPIVVLDPGHGGSDTGYVNANGLIESRIALDLAQEVKKILDHSSVVSTVLTRDKNELISLSKRIKFIESHHPTLLVSLHTSTSQCESLQSTCYNIAYS